MMLIFCSSSLTAHYVINKAIFSLRVPRILILLVDLALQFEELFVMEVELVWVLLHPHIGNCDVLLGHHHLVEQL